MTSLTAGEAAGFGYGIASGQVMSDEMKQSIGMVVDIGVGLINAGSGGTAVACNASRLTRITKIANILDEFSDVSKIKKASDVVPECLKNASDEKFCVLNAGDFGKAVDNVPTHSAFESTIILRRMAKEEFGITAPIEVIDEANWIWKGSAACTRFVKGKPVVQILNRPMHKMVGAMRHEMTHVMQWIKHPNYMAWALSDYMPASTIVRFIFELEAHSIYTLAKTPFQGALQEAMRHRVQVGTDLLYLVLLGGGGGGGLIYYATRPNNR